MDIHGATVKIGMLYFVDCASLYNSVKWPTWHILLFLYVYFNSVHVSSNFVAFSVFSITNESN
jgi:hypothetical protein